MYFNSPSGARDRSKSKGKAPEGKLGDKKHPTDLGGNRSSSNKSKPSLPPRPEQILEKMGIEEILRRAAEEQERIHRGEKVPKLVANADEGLSGASNPSGCRLPSNTTKDTDLMTSLAKRVATLEKLLDNYKKELKDKSIEAADLKDKLHTLQILSKEGQVSEDKITAVEKLKAENTQLKDELHEIKEYLMDHGVKWKGSKETSEGKLKVEQIKAEISTKKPAYNFDLPKEIDLGVVAMRVAELNYTIRKEGQHTEIKKGADGIHKLEAKKPKLLIFYKNGVHLEGFPIFYNGSHDALALISDILDGYFPRQLEKSFPDGVLLEIVDKLDEVYDGKSTAINSNTPGNMMSLAQLAQQPLQPMKKEEFLKLIPESMTKDGKIIHVRKAVEDRLSGQSSGHKNATCSLKNVVKEESGMWVVQNEQYLDPSLRGSPETSLLKVRIDSLGESLICHISKLASIQDLHRLLVSCLAKNTKKWKIVNGFPRTVFDLASNETLEELELFPRAAIFLQEAD